MRLCCSPCSTPAPPPIVSLRKGIGECSLAKLVRSPKGFFRNRIAGPYMSLRVQEGAGAVLQGSMNRGDLALSPLKRWFRFTFASPRSMLEFLCDNFWGSCLWVTQPQSLLVWGRGSYSVSCSGLCLPLSLWQREGKEHNEDSGFISFPL